MSRFFSKFCATKVPPVTSGQTTMSSSDLSDLSSPLSTDEELANAPIRPGTLEHYFQNAGATANQASPPAKKKRPPSPPHEYVLADNPDIAVSLRVLLQSSTKAAPEDSYCRVTNACGLQFIVMFRSRFGDAFPKSLPHYGPQDIERGVSGTSPDDHVERLLCAMLGLVLNRKKDVEWVSLTELSIHAGLEPLRIIATFSYRLGLTGR